MFLIGLQLRQEGTGGLNTNKTLWFVEISQIFLVFPIVLPRGYSYLTLLRLLLSFHVLDEARPMLFLGCHFCEEVDDAIES